MKKIRFIILISFSILLLISSFSPVFGIPNTSYNYTYINSSLGGNSDAGSELVGIRILGHGYDVFGQYAAPVSVKIGKIFNLPDDGMVQYKGTTYALPQIVTFVQDDSTELRAAYGQNLSSFLDQFKISGSVGAPVYYFLASLSTDFGITTATTNTYCYSKVMQVVHKYILSLPDPSSPQLRTLLNPQFQKDLRSMDPNQLFDIYGAYYIQKMVMGARLCLTSTTKINTSTIKIDISNAAKATLTDGLGISIGLSNQSEKETYLKNSEINMVAFGGDPQYGSSIFSVDDGSYSQDNYLKWLASINGNLNINFDPNGNSLVPIWKLCDDPARQAELQNAFNIYAQGKQIPNLNARDAVVDLMLVEDGNPSIPQGWNKTAWNLNKWLPWPAKAIYLLYKMGLSTDGNPAPITDLTCVSGNQPAPSGWTKMEVELNDGDAWLTGAHRYIYLCYKQEAGKPPITGIVTYKYGEQQDPGYTLVDWWDFSKNNHSYQSANLNSDTGTINTNIYIAYTTQPPMTQ